MGPRGAFRFVGALLFIGIIGTLMALAFAAGAATSGAANAGVNGWQFFGFLFLMLIVVMIFGGLGAGRRRMYGSWHSYGQVGPGEWHGRGGWHGDYWADARKAALNEWHRKAHAEQASSGGPTRGGAPSDPTTGPQA